MSDSRFRVLRIVGVILLFVATVILPVTGCRHVSLPDNASRLDHSALVIVLDGLRPDYVTPELMPNLHALGERGVVGRNHHSVFPTVTRVNAASIVTGSYPERHGLMGNSVYFPEISPDTKFSTGNATHLQRIEAATGGRLLTAPSLGEILEQAGRELLAVSAGSSGSAFLLNHKATGGGLIHTELILPASNRPRVLEMLGPAPAEAKPNAACNRRAVDSYLKIGLGDTRPHVTLMWLSDPDHTQHGEGVGAPLTLQSIRLVDAEIGRIVAALAEKGLRDKVNIFVTSDHGFSTHTGGAYLDGLLKSEVQSGNVFIVEGGIYVKNRDAERIHQIVQLLQKTPWVGAIFTRPARPGRSEGSIPGTLSLDLAHWSHARAADILVSADWTDGVNQFGYRGTSTQSGVAGHGTSSPYDVHNTLVAAGPDIKSGVVSGVPTGNVDFAPTLCFLTGIRPPANMNGRVLMELLRDGPSPDSVRVQHLVHHTKVGSEAGEYRLELSHSIVNGTDYLNFTKVKRHIVAHDRLAPAR